MNPIIIYLSFGTNLGNREKNLRAAWDALPPAVHPTAASPIYETDPWGYEQQPAFLNQVIRGETQLAPADLLTALKRLEVSLGREPNFRWGPRSIDIDILLYGDLSVRLPDLVIPHARLAERAFVLVPLADLAPDLVVPGTRDTVSALLERVDAASVRPYRPGHKPLDSQNQAVE